MMPQIPEDAFINLLRSVYNNAQHSSLRLTARRPSFASIPGSSVQHLSTLSHSRARLQPSIGHRTLRGGANDATRDRKQPYATASGSGARPPREIAVLGAGITGLTAAHYLARHAKNAHITIYEASNSPGGWIKGDRVKVQNGEGQEGHVLLQKGPRMLRSSNRADKYDDLVLYDVLASLNMSNEIIHEQARSQHRYLYYPDHLVKLPTAELTLDNVYGSLASFMTEPLWEGGLSAVFNLWLSSRKMSNSKTMNKPPEDESVAQFLTDILGDDRIVNNVVSGVMHGIYGGDINKLSAKHTLAERMWYTWRAPTKQLDLARIHFKELYLLADMMDGPNRLKVIELAEQAVNWGTIMFKDGLLSLVNGLVKDLKARKNVVFNYGQPVTSLEYDKDGVEVGTEGRTDKYDHVICTLFSKQLAQITKPRDSLRSLAETHAVTIMVVNLWYPDPNLLDQGGFGYLIPATTPDNDEGALGVLFDSDIRPDNGEMPGTKLTVMLGGHHWDSWSHLPTESMGIAMAKEVVRRQLGITEAETVVAEARLCRDCLPQHFVGHRKRMNDAHYELLSTFQGRLTVAGPSYTSVGVIPAMRAGFDAGMRVARGRAQPWFRLPVQTSANANDVSQTERDYWNGFARLQAQCLRDGSADIIGATGLEQFTGNEFDSLVLTPREELMFRKFTGKAFRFVDESGKFLHVHQRLVKNAPRGFDRRI